MKKLKLTFKEGEIISVCSTDSIHKTSTITITLHGSSNKFHKIANFICKGREKKSGLNSFQRRTIGVMGSRNGGITTTEGLKVSESGEVVKDETQD